MTSPTKIKYLIYCNFRKQLIYFFINPNEQILNIFCTTSTLFIVRMYLYVLYVVLQINTNVKSIIINTSKPLLFTTEHKKKYKFDMIPTIILQRAKTLLFKASDRSNDFVAKGLEHKFSL